MAKLKRVRAVDKSLEGIGVSKTSDGDYRVVHKQDGVAIYAYGFGSYEKAERAWFQIAEALRDVRFGRDGTMA